MSTYTNDTDAVRQLITVDSHLIQSPDDHRADLHDALIPVWPSSSSFVVGRPGVPGLALGTRPFPRSAQQAALADEEGFIEEMMDGQKVVQGLQPRAGCQGRVRRATRNSSTPQKANIYGNVPMLPALGNIGNIMYVVIATVKWRRHDPEQTPNVHLFGINVITVGIVVSASGHGPTSDHRPMQVPMIALGMAGAGRVFPHRQGT